MFWPMLAIALGFCGLAVLAVLTARVFVETRRLARQVAQATRNITRAAEELERSAAPLAAQGGRGVPGE
ncbi:MULTISPECIES: hypothetical protein [Streptomyces]|uniref:Membrane protein n=1 Tax=Streptomyces luteosporeus TaxID=173856 RepID=A0ABN3TM63_9ACTN